MQKAPGLYISGSALHGLGVFCAHRLDAGDIIEICPVLVLGEGDLVHLDRTGLYDYYWLWGPDRKRPAIALGYGSLYNHSFNPNAMTELITNDNQIVFQAIMEIGPNEEILIDYSAGESEYRNLWFDPVL